MTKVQNFSVFFSFPYVMCFIYSVDAAAETRLIAKDIMTSYNILCALILALSNTSIVFCYVLLVNYLMDHYHQ